MSALNVTSYSALLILLGLSSAYGQPIASKPTGGAAKPAATSTPAPLPTGSPAAAGAGAASKAPSAGGLDGESVPNPEDPKFLEKLQTMLDRTEKSISLIRVQIVQNQSAPFLANLYMQLGDLLARKSTIYYYMQMERDKNTDLKVQATKKFSPVVSAEQEAIGIYQQLIKEFPKFDQLDRVLYRLAISQKSIDEIPAFIATAEKLIQSFPKTKEATQVKLLLGQHFYDEQDYEQSLKYLAPVEECSFPYERNAAKYRAGLIYILQEKHKDALNLFEQIALDDELKEDDNPMELSLKTKSIKTNIKREALIDSVRAYTEVYKENPEPVSFYSRLAPTEVLFQETIEKLAYRYIFLKKYNFAIKLLRTLCERIPDPQKVVNIYHEVLLMIPIGDRIDLPVQEMQFVLEKYQYWYTHYELSDAIKKASFEFFEKQIRELGTHAHDLAKVEKNPETRAHLYERARLFYLLYLGFFDRGARSAHIATDLADVFYNQSNYLESGSYYLRVFAGEFGPTTQKADLIQNAILSLQKPSEYEFYEQLRAKGLLVKAIRSYQQFDKKQLNDPSLNFALAKTNFEQGYYETALPELLQFMKKFPKAKEVDAAVDLIIYYFNIRSDYKGMTDWTSRILALNLPGAELRNRVKDVHSKALLKRLDETVKTQKGYDTFSQGKSYLQTALSVGDASMRSAALEQALGRSKAERDINTFIATGFAMARSEKDGKKRGEIFASVAEETLAITRFNLTIAIWNRVLEDKSVPANLRQQVFEKEFKLNLILRDLNKLETMMASPLFKTASADLKKSAHDQISGFLDSPVMMPAGLSKFLIETASTDEDWLALYKARPKMPLSYQKVIASKANQRCAGSVNSNLCKWARWSEATGLVLGFANALTKTPATLPGMQDSATRVNAVLSELKAYEGSGDPLLDIMLSLATAKVYRDFAGFLQKMANANASSKDLVTALNEKANESLASSEGSRKQCQSIVAAAGLSLPNHISCEQPVLADPDKILAWRNSVKMGSVAQDQRSGEFVEKEKALFVNHQDWKLYFDMAEAYLNHGLWSQAAATAVYGISTFPQSQEEFNAILGCSALHMGFKAEAKYELSKASELGGHKQQCLSLIKNESSSQ